MEKGTLFIAFYKEHAISLKSNKTKKLKIKLYTEIFIHLPKVFYVDDEEVIKAAVSDTPDTPTVAAKDSM